MNRPMTENQIVNEYLPLVKSIARKYKGIPQEDLIQEGLLGLIQAFRKFDPAREVKFSTFATYYIRKYILKAVELEYHSTTVNSAPEQPQVSPGTIDPESVGISLPEQMPALERRIVLLSIDEQKSLKEISSILLLRVEQVRILRDKALRRLKHTYSKPE